MVRKKLGPVAEKILLLLEAGVVLGLTQRPDQYFRVVRRTAQEWKRINERSLHGAVKRMYGTDLIDCKERKDGSYTLTLTDSGKARVAHARVDSLAIPKPPTWDGLWRVVIFDVPERLKRGRVVLSRKLKALGFHPLQKSVFIFPYECRKEVDFIVTEYDLRPYVYFLLVKETSSDRFLRRKFSLG